MSDARRRPPPRQTDSSQGGHQPGAKVKPIPAPPRRCGLSLRKIFLVGLMIVGGYGAYFGYCRYHAGAKVKTLATAADELRQKLLRVNHRVSAEDIKAAVVGFAAEAGVEVDPGSIRVTIEPLDSNNVTKLPRVAAMAMGVAMNVPKHQTPRFLVGFEARFRAKHGVAKIEFEHRRYTYLADHLVSQP